MLNWLDSVEKFLDSWKNTCVTGALVCGSYVTGNPSKRSDIDVHLILSEETKWRERGNHYIDGYLIEYFANPPRQIYEYFEEDYQENRRTTATMFVTGKILFDKDGILQIIIAKAEEWLNRDFTEPSIQTIELWKYGLWDILDNMHDLYEKNSKSFNTAYFNALNNTRRTYTKYLRCEYVSPEKIVEYYTDLEARKKYLQEEFPDSVFANKFLVAINCKKRCSKLDHIEKIITYVLDEMGGFNIDGWKIRTQTTV